MGELMKSFCLFCPKTALQNLKTGKDVIVIVFFVCSSKLWACGWNPIWCNHLNETSPGTIWFVYQVVLSCNPVRLWCYHGNETSSAVLSHGSICFVCSSDFWACSSGGSRGGALGARAPPLFFDQNEARRAEKKICGDWPPLISGSGWPLPPSEGLDLPLTVDETSPAALLHSSRFVCSSKSWACGWNSIWCNHSNETLLSAVLSHGAIYSSLRSKRFLATFV